MTHRLANLALVTTATLVLMGAGCTNTNTATTTNTSTKNTNTTTVTTNETNRNTTANTNTETVVTFDASATDAEVLNDTNGQWAATATASSEYGADSWSAKQATGKPNVNTYSDNASAWAPLKSNGGEETLELTFAQAVTPVGLRIRESYGSGTITKVELKGVDDTYYTVWSGDDTTEGLAYLQVAVEDADYEADGARITFDTSDLVLEWAEIDAVQLVGE